MRAQIVDDQRQHRVQPCDRHQLPVHATSTCVPYPEWGIGAEPPVDRRVDYHALQMAFTKRMSNRWQASATYLLSGQWDLQKAPFAGGCQYVTTLNAAGQPVCDVPVDAAPDHRATSGT